MGPTDERPGEETKVLRVTGFDPVAGSVETVDLLKQKLVRRVRVVRDTDRSKVAEHELRVRPRSRKPWAEVRETDLRNAVAVYS